MVHIELGGPHHRLATCAGKGPLGVFLADVPMTHAAFKAIATTLSLGSVGYDRRRLNRAPARCCGKDTPDLRAAPLLGPYHLLRGKGEQLSIKAMSINPPRALPDLEVVQDFPSTLERQPALFNSLFVGQVSRKFLDGCDMSALHQIASHLPIVLPFVLIVLPIALLRPLGALGFDVNQ
jgi:hypothetical protein